MKIIDESKTETYLINYLDESREPFYARFGLLETADQEIALAEGLQSQDLEWINFDENIFYWLCVHQGETIEKFTEEEPWADFYYVKSKEVE